GSPSRLITVTGLTKWIVAFRIDPWRVILIIRGINQKLNVRSYWQSLHSCAQRMPLRLPICGFNNITPEETFGTITFIDLQTYRCKGGAGMNQKMTFRLQCQCRYWSFIADC